MFSSSEYRQRVLGPLTEAHLQLFLKNARFVGLKFPDMSRPETLQKRFVGKVIFSVSHRTAVYHIRSHSIALNDSISNQVMRHKVYHIMSYDTILYHVVSYHIRMRGFEGLTFPDASRPEILREAVVGKALPRLSRCITIYHIASYDMILYHIDIILCGIISYNAVSYHIRMRSSGG